jgi:hypothetical protein
MKPQGYRVRIWTDRNARSQRIIGTQEKARAESCGRQLSEYLWSLKSTEAENREGNENPGVQEF